MPQDTIPAPLAIEFVQNYQDLSTDKGYQFKFFCDKSGSSSSYDIQRAIGGPAHDRACPSCGAHTSGGEFCPECGANLSPSVNCSGCGKKIEGKPKFCPDC